jgi:hypothetical protein
VEIGGEAGVKTGAGAWGGKSGEEAGGGGLHRGGVGGGEECVGFFLFFPFFRLGVGGVGMEDEDSVSCYRSLVGTLPFIRPTFSIQRL